MEQIMDEYITRLAQATHDNIILNIENKRLLKELEEIKKKAYKSEEAEE